MSGATIDYIVVGQGLAGSAMAFQLLKRKKRILVFDQPAQNNSSRIAAGLFNPITGKKLVRTWMADQLFPYLHTFYCEAEAETKTRFFFPMPLYRPFLSVEEQNEWMAKSADPRFEPYVEKVFLSTAFHSVQDDFGGLLLRQSGYLDTKIYINAIRNLILEKGIYIENHFDQNQLKISEAGVHYGQYTAGNIIFCEGSVRNKWFDWLPVRPLKGETIFVEAGITENVIFNRGVYAVPASQTGGGWRVGATYNFQDAMEGCTTEARAELELKLDNLLAVPFESKGQEWGFRPTTPDRRPLLGRHPECDRILIFNGLGTKGVSLSPYFSEVLIHSIENGIALDKAVDIERYKSLYWSSPK
ncbi:MAG TPA: FAD-dependent oxidoreductase [Ohtaekwangia sp.]